MKALLLAAGLGTRLRPITDYVPKCLVAIKEKPLLQYWLERLLSESSSRAREAGVAISHNDNTVHHILINTHYFSTQVEDFIKTSPWAEYVTLVYEPTLLGTGGTVLKNRAWLQDGPFILAHADNLTRFDVKAFIEAHQNRPAQTEITMMTFDTDVPERCGIIESNEQGIVTAFYEKSTENHGARANAAVYIIEPSVIDFLASLGKEEIDFSTEVIPHYLGRMQIFHNADYHRDIGTPESLQLAQVEY